MLEITLFDAVKRIDAAIDKDTRESDIETDKFKRLISSIQDAFHNDGDELFIDIVLRKNIEEYANHSFIVEISRSWMSETSIGVGAKFLDRLGVDPDDLSIIEEYEMQKQFSIKLTKD